jgi:hypothetical protein
LGDPLLDTSRSLLAAKSEDANAGNYTTAEKGPSFDVFFDGGGDRGVLFVSRTGIIYDQLAQQSIVLGMGFKKAKKKDVARVPRLSLPCSSLTDITLRGSNLGTFSHNLAGHQPEVNIATNSTTLRFLFGFNIHPQAVKQTIADFCSRQ